MTQSVPFLAKCRNSARGIESVSCHPHYSQRSAVMIKSLIRSPCGFLPHFDFYCIEIHHMAKISDFQKFWSFWNVDGFMVEICLGRHFNQPKMINCAFQDTVFIFCGKTRFSYIFYKIVLEMKKMTVLGIKVVWKWSF